MNKKSQIWIETVLYTLIGLALIGVVLAFITPKINQQKEKSLIEQTMTSLNTLDNKINSVLETGPDNIRIIELGIKRGRLFFNSEEEKISFIIEGLSSLYTEPDVEVNFGRIKAISKKGRKENNLTLTLSYGNMANITFNGEDKNGELTSSSVPYKLSIENKGNTNSFFNIININKIS